MLNLFLASQAHWLHHIYGYLCGSGQHFEYLCMLLFRWNGNPKLRENERWFNQLQLVHAACGYTKILHSDDSECSTPNVLSRIQNNYFEFGNISRREHFFRDLHFAIEDHKLHSCPFQMIRKVFTYYMLFKTITAEWIIWLNVKVSALGLSKNTDDGSTSSTS